MRYGVFDVWILDIEMLDIEMLGVVPIFLELNLKRKIVFKKPGSPFSLRFRKK
jgi:hypothetical protein